jgi:hypothetical protein
MAPKPASREGPPRGDSSKLARLGCRAPWCGTVGREKPGKPCEWPLAPLHSNRAISPLIPCGRSTISWELESKGFPLAMPCLRY